MMRRGVTTMARARAQAVQAVQAVVGARARALGTFEGAEQEELAYAPKKAVKFEPTEPTFLTQFTMQREKVKATMESVEDQERVVRQVVGMLGGSLKSFYVTQTGPYDGLCVYTFPKNHDSRTLTCLLRSMVGCDRIETTKLMSSTDAAMSAKAAAQLYKTLKK